ncbi:MAG: AAC(3) family N-acetyltransferase [Clostridia bacterium]|nr:AAC(3) family N-acetyltransferase [Clostridia bacterium]
MDKMPDWLFEPHEIADGDYYNENLRPAMSNRWVWLTSMFTGMAPILYHTDGDRRALKWAEKYADSYHDKVFQDYSPTTHDIGFIYIPYSVYMYQLTGNKAHRATALRAAEELAKRFQFRGGFIDAWSEMRADTTKEHRMIIDSCMNVPLLFWAWKETNHSFFYDVATIHLETIIKVLVRDDWSVAHAWFFDPVTGEPTKEANSCGYANGTHWARGTAWIVCGLAQAYEYTMDEKYLDIATKIGEKYLDSLEDSLVPVWDFRLPADMPAKGCGNVDFHWDETDPANKIYNVDTSAAAIITCGFQILAKHSGNQRFKKYVEDALEVLSNEYLDDNLEITGMLTRSNGRDKYTSFGDYYYMLALAVQLYGIRTSLNGPCEKHVVRPFVTFFTVKKALAELGVKEGDTILTHSSFKSVGITENGADTVVRGMLETVGKTGNVVFPTLCQKDWPNIYKNWHIGAHSDTGYLTNYFRLLPDAKRSNQATHSVAVIGKDADNIIETHGKSGLRYGIFGETPFAADSPWEKLYNMDAKVIFMGVGIKKCTFRHYAEYLYMEKMLEKAKKSPNYEELKNRVWTFCKAGVWPHIASEYVKEVLDKQGKVKYGTCGEADLQMVSAKDFVDCALDLLEKRDRKVFYEEGDTWNVQDTLDWLEEVDKI